MYRGPHATPTYRERTVAVHRQPKRNRQAVACPLVKSWSLGKKWEHTVAVFRRYCPKTVEVTASHPLYLSKIVTSGEYSATRPTESAYSVGLRDEMMVGEGKNRRAHQLITEWLTESGLLTNFQAHLTNLPHICDHGNTSDDLSPTYF